MTDLSEAPVRRVGVTTLADFACRSGDLDGGGVVGPTARDGQRAHQRIQAESHADVEVTLKRRLRLGNGEIELSGRLDLLDRANHVIGEIKSALVPAERVPESRRRLHHAQLRLYGWLWLGQDDVEADSLTLELVHVNLRSGETATLSETVLAAELVEHAETALQAWCRWQDEADERRRQLIATAARLVFPHANYRDGQRTMSVAVYRSLRDRQALLIEAPTGIGKTISSLYPAARALGDGHCRQVFYLTAKVLTAKVSGRRSAQSALQRMVEDGLAISAVTLRSRASACFCERGLCERQDDGRCPMTLGYHDRLPDARRELLQLGVVSNTLFDEIAWDHQLCPHALARHVLPWADVVIGDFNHVFDPLSRLAGADEPAPDAVLLVDEAHNLPSRGRDMFSASLAHAECVALARIVSTDWPSMARHADQLARAVNKVARRSLDDPEPGEATTRLDASTIDVISTDVPEGLVAAAAELLASISEALIDGVALPPEVRAFQQRLSRFAVVAALYGDDHRTLIETRNLVDRRVTRVRLCCLDARDRLHRQHGRFGASICFSATLTPAAVYRDSLGLPASTQALSLASPFDPARVFPAVISWINTRYRQRDDSLVALVDLIARSSARRSGNYLVCLASHAYLERVHDAYRRAHPDCEIWRQRAEDTPEIQAANLDRLDTAGHRIGFVILGGVYAEGIDYADERLVGVFIVGTALTPPGKLEDVMIERATARGENGFDQVSRYPGFSRAMQTAGRVIRTERDKGVVMLIDDRYAESFYRRLFPAHWSIRWPLDADELICALDTFWQSIREEADQDESNA